MKFISNFFILFLSHSSIHSMEHPTQPTSNSLPYILTIKKAYPEMPPESSLSEDYIALCLCKCTGEKIGEAIFNPTAGELKSLRVTEKYRRKSYGKLLFQTVEEQIRRKNYCQRMTWIVQRFELNSPSQEVLYEFYRKMGGNPDPEAKFEGSFFKLLK